MGLLQTFQDRVRARLRSFVLGPGVVDRADMIYGRQETYTPEEYGDYVSKSSAVYSIITMRAQMLASLPLKLHRMSPKGDAVDVTAGQAFDLFHRVNPRWTFNRLMQMTELSLCLWGEAFWFLERGETGDQPPREIWWGKPSRVIVQPDPVDYVRGFIYQPARLQQNLHFAPSEVIWFRYPNPVDEFEGLSPLAAACLAADTNRAAMVSNYNLFKNGLNPGGMVVPKNDGMFSSEQAQQLEELLTRRFQGVDKAHRWGVLRFDASIEPLGISPKDAEFTDMLAMTLEDIARAYHWPLDLIGGQRTYANVEASRLLAWENAIVPEAAFISEEINEQLLPMFGVGEPDHAEFDFESVSVFQEAKANEWGRAREQIQTNAITINEWRATQNKPAVVWGDMPLIELNAWVNSRYTPVLFEPALSEPASSADSTDSTPRGARSAPALIYGSDEHRALWRRFDERATKQERIIAKVARELFRRQKKSILAKMRGAMLTRDFDEDDPFDRKEWTKRFRVGIRPALRTVIASAGKDALKDLGLSIAFNLLDSNVVRFLEGRAQRFAVEVNETTWHALKDALKAGIEEGETIDKLAERVESVMELRENQSSEVIARTETVGAFNGGTLEAWKQTDGLVKRKRWLASLDDRVRDTHAEANGQTVDLDEDFEVGSARGPAPGQMGEAEEDCNCRCTIVAVVED